MRRTVAALVALCAGGVLASPGHASVRSSAPAAVAAKTSRVKLTSRTVVISPTLVRKYLVGVTRDGRTFKFKRAVGSLRRLRRGRVMLLKGKDVAKVTKVRRSRGRLLVTAQPAELTDVIRSGHIRFHGKPNFRRAFLARSVPFPKRGRAARRFEAPGYPYLGSPSPRMAVTAADPPSFSIQGSAGHVGYSLKFTPASPRRLDISGVICFQLGSICSNGPSNGVSAEVKVSGFLEMAEQDVGLSIDGGRVTNSSLSIKHLRTHAHLTYTIARGVGDNDPSPPVLRVPIGLDFPVPGPAGLPLYFKVQTALIFKWGFTSKNAVIRGGADLTTSGTDTIKQAGNQVTAAQSGGSADVSILTHQNGGVGPSKSFLPSGAVVAAQLKLGAGLGVRAANGIGYIDTIASSSQTTSPAFGGIGGHYCSHYGLDVTVNGGFEAQIGPLAFTSSSKELGRYERQVTEVGCPRT
jgi:hypothetical protein